MSKPKLIIFASGSATGGGSGFEKLVIASYEGILNAEITAVVSNYVCGGVCKRAEKLGVPFFHFPAPWLAKEYQKWVKCCGADFVSLSGWLKLVSGLDPRVTFNIHPGPLPDFGGPGMYGHHVHEAVHRAYHNGTITHSAVSMHFITDEYDRGPIFFHMPVEITSDDTADDIGTRVNKVEHQWQPLITNLVVNGEISWDGKDPKSVHVPKGYQFF